MTGACNGRGTGSSIALANDRISALGGRLLNHGKELLNITHCIVRILFNHFDALQHDSLYVEDVDTVPFLGEIGFQGGMELLNGGASSNECYTEARLYISVPGLTC